MGARKRLAAEKRKEAKKNKSFAVLKDCPTSPRKMRLMADLIRNKSVDEALDILKFSNKDASRRLEKVLMSAIANWQNKNEGVKIEDAELFVNEVFVDSARMLKRIKPAAQGRAFRIRKRSNHVTLEVKSAADMISEDIDEAELEQANDNNEISESENKA